LSEKNTCAKFSSNLNKQYYIVLRSCKIVSDSVNSINTSSTFILCILNLPFTYCYILTDQSIYTRFVRKKISVLIFLCMTWECSTSMYIDKLVMTLAACTYLFKLYRLDLSWATVVCVRSCFITSVMFVMQPWYCSQRIFTSRTDS
jgi:hypothetical protein